MIRYSSYLGMILAFVVNSSIVFGQAASATISATSGPSVSPDPVLIGDSTTADITVQATPDAAVGQQTLMAGSESLQYRYVWKRGPDTLATHGPTAANSDSHSFSTLTPGSYTISCSVSVTGTADYVDPNGVTHSLNVTGGPTSFSVSLQVDDYQIALEVKSQLQQESSYSGSTSIAAGGHNSPPHIADVRVRVMDGQGNALGGRTITSALIGGGGADGTAAALTMSGTTDANGYALGTLKSSDKKETATVKITKVNGISLGSPPTASVIFDWSITRTWVSEPEWIELQGGNTETITLKWSGADLEGHDIRFWITKVHLADGNEVDYQNAGAYATITNQPGPTDAQGTVTATITCVAETWDDWDWLEITWWDFSVND